MLYELLGFLKAMNRSDMLASPNAGLYSFSFYFIALSFFWGLTGHFIGFRPLPSVTENKYASSASLYIKSLTQLVGLKPPKMWPEFALTKTKVGPILSHLAWNLCAPPPLTMVFLFTSFVC